MSGWAEDCSVGVDAWAMVEPGRPSTATVNTPADAKHRRRVLRCLFVIRFLPGSEPERMLTKVRTQIASRSFAAPGELPQSHKVASASLPAAVSAPHLKMAPGSAFLFASTFSQEKGTTPLQV